MNNRRDIFAITSRLIMSRVFQICFFGVDFIVPKPPERLSYQSLRRFDTIWMAIYFISPYSIASRNLISIAATSARVASPCGFMLPSG